MQECFEDLMSQYKSESSRMCEAHWNLRDYYHCGVNHLSYPLQSDSSAGEQLYYREGGEMMIGDVKWWLGKPEDGDGGWWGGENC